MLTPPEMVSPVRKEPILPIIEPQHGSTDVSLENLSEEDPFSDSDLPVTMEDQ